MKTETKTETKTYVGVADCHGIEYFQGADEPRSVPLEVRASLRRQRHALYYEVELTDERAGFVRDLMKDKKFSAALTYLKMAKGVNLSVEEDMVESLKLIPDPKLDPFGG